MDRMDEWLSRLPQESPSPDLVPRVLARLEARRGRDRQVRRTLRAASVLAGSLGLALAWPQLGLVLFGFTYSPLESLGAWAAVLLQSPLEAVMLAFQQPWQISQALGSGLQLGLIAALILIAAAGSYGAAHLLTLQENQEVLPS